MIPISKIVGCLRLNLDPCIVNLLMSRGTASALLSTAWDPDVGEFFSKLDSVINNWHLKIHTRHGLK